MEWHICFALDGFRASLCLLALFLWLGGILTNGRTVSRYDRIVRSIVCLAALGVFLSGDFFTLLVFFEPMSLCASLWLFGQKNAESQKTGGVYLVVALLGGFSMLCGLALLQLRFGTLEFSALQSLCAELSDRRALYPACTLLTVGFAAKAGVWPLHFWLPGTYRHAPNTASAIFSGLLSKTGIYGLLLISRILLPGDESWIYAWLLLGCLTMAAGSLGALCERRVKGVLAYSSMAQMGLLVIGCALAGLPGAAGILAARGVLLHMTVHGLSKAALFWLCEAGGLKHDTTLLECAGKGRGEPFLQVIFCVAGASLAGFPLLGGCLSKTLLHESLVAAAEALPFSGLPLIEALFLLLGGCTLCYLLRLYWALFWARKEPGKTFARAKAKPSRRFALLAAVLPLPLLGTWVSGTDGLLDRVMLSLGVAPPARAVAYFSWHSLQGILISLLFGAVLFVLLQFLERRGGISPGITRQMPRFIPKAVLSLLNLGGYLAEALVGWAPLCLRGLQRHVFDGRWDVEAPPENGADFSRYEQTPVVQTEHSLSRTLLLLMVGLCLMIAMICLACI